MSNFARWMCELKYLSSWIVWSTPDKSSFHGLLMRGSLQGISWIQGLWFLHTPTARHPRLPIRQLTFTHRWLATCKTIASFRPGVYGTAAKKTVPSNQPWLLWRGHTRAKWALWRVEDHGPKQGIFQQAMFDYVWGYVWGYGLRPMARSACGPHSENKIDRCWKFLTHGTSGRPRWTHCWYTRNIEEHFLLPASIWAPCSVHRGIVCGWSFERAWLTQYYTIPVFSIVYPLLFNFNMLGGLKDIDSPHSKEGKQVDC